MLVSSVQAVVACYVTAPKVCTLVLFIFKHNYIVQRYSRMIPYNQYILYMYRLKINGELHLISTDTSGLGVTRCHYNIIYERTEGCCYDTKTGWFSSWFMGYTLQPSYNYYI